jgi:hypothetical protein
MNKLILGAAVMLFLPTAVFLGGGWIMTEISGRELVKQQEPLNQRFGYNVDAVHGYWQALDERARGAEVRFLELDLVFPFLYGGALATGLLLGWASLGRRFNPAWLLAPVAIALLADWTENLVQLGQLRRFSAHKALQESWIRVASAATTTKLLFLYSLCLVLLSLFLMVLGRAFRST